MSRGWTPLDLPVWEEDGYYDKVRSRCDYVAAEISRIEQASEQRHFQRISNMEDGRNDYDFEDEDEAEQFEFARKLKEGVEAAKIEYLTDELTKLGARMMRPYEHWNEDEKYMEYMERGD